MTKAQQQQRELLEKLPGMLSLLYSPATEGEEGAYFVSASMVAGSLYSRFDVRPNPNQIGRALQALTGTAPTFKRMSGGEVRRGYWIKQKIVQPSPANVL